MTKNKNKKCVIDNFWVETEIRDKNRATKKIDATSQASHWVTVENLTHFPANLTVGGLIPQKSTGIMFEPKAYEWEKIILMLRPREVGSEKETIKYSCTHEGMERIHAGILSYYDHTAGVDHALPEKHPLSIAISVKK